MDKLEKHKFLVPLKTKKISTSDVFTFVFDRTRSIRQELVILGESTNKHHITLLEKIARFHCMAANEILNLGCIDMKQNSEQFTSTMTSLRESYDLVNQILAEEGEKYANVQTDNMYQSPKEGEFRALMILTQINDNLEVLETLRSLRKETRMSKEVKLATEIFKAYQNRDTERYFRLFRKAPYLIACC